MNESAKHFKRELRNHHVDLNSFLTLFNKWVELSTQEKSFLIKEEIKDR